MSAYAYAYADTPDYSANANPDGGGRRINHERRDHFDIEVTPGPRLHGVNVNGDYAAIAAGADGLIIEVHPEPPKAWSDSEQSLSFPEFGDLMDDLRRFEYLRNPTSPTNRPTTAPPAELEERMAAGTVWVPAPSTPSA